MTKAAGILLLTALITTAGAADGAAAPSPAGHASTPQPLPSGPDDHELDAAVASIGRIHVIVTMHRPARPTARPATVDTALATLDARLSGTDSRVVDELEVIPAALLEVDAAGLDRLRADPAVASVSPNREFRLLLDSSTAVINSDLLNAAGIRGRPSRGRPFEIAVIDTGVARRHNALRGKVVHEACFSINRGCANRRRTDGGRGAAAPCTFSSQCFHGTHVAATAAGAAFRNGHEGVAPNARIVAIRVGHRPSPDGFALTQWDLDRSLERVLRLRRRGRPIVAVNLSLGFQAFTPRQCRQLRGISTSQLIAQLTGAGVAVVAAAGNDGFNRRISYPACLPAAYAVSATNDQDRRARFSDVSASTDFYAPGVDVVAPIPGRPNAKGSASGTSMATPHVAGAFALLRQCVGNRGPADVARDLKATGKRIRAAGVTRRRINVLAAATRNVPNDKFARPRRIRFRGRSIDIAAWNTCATAERGEPRIGRPENTVWFVWRPARAGRATITTDPVRGHPTNFNTELSVFTGRRLDRLQLVDYDNNGGTGKRSRIVIRVQPTKVYRIRVDGVNAANGRFNLHVGLRG